MVGEEDLEAVRPRLLHRLVDPLHLLPADAPFGEIQINERTVLMPTTTNSSS